MNSWKEYEIESKYDNNGKIFFCKWDFWCHGKHWMTSASRGLYDDIWLAIHNTFYDNLNKDNEGITEFIEKILYLRKYRIEILKQVRNSMEDVFTQSDKEFLYHDVINSLFTPYTPKRVKVEEFYSGWEKENLKEVDSKIYKNFHDFFLNAEHGFSKSGEGYLVVKEFWDSLIPEISVEKLEKQYNEELNELNEFINLEKVFIKAWFDSNLEKPFHKFKIKYIRENLSI